ncbi:MAG: PAS domain S-box protein [Planctomycetota bacterium]|jgi:PAS domain S-box-containing protein
MDTQDQDFAERLLETLPVIVLVLDNEARIVRFNRYMEQVSGYSLEEMRGKNWFESFLHKRHHRRIQQVFDDALAGEQIVGNINPILTKDGSEREIEWFATVLRDADGNTTGLLSAGRDVTEQLRVMQDLRERQAQFQSLVSAVIDPIVATDVEGKVLACNPAVDKVFGWKPEELLGRNVGVLMGKPYSDEHSSYIQRYLDTGEQRAIGNVRKVVARRKNGRGFAAEISISEVKEGGSMRFVGVVRDISEREEIMAKLAQSERLAAIGELAAGVAHEINNPVNTIINCAQLLTDGDTDSELYDDILHEGNRIATIVRGLLDFAREKDEDFHPVNLSAVARQAVSLVQRRFEKTGIDIIVKAADDLPPVPGRFQQLEQVVLNLLLNARDALFDHEVEGGKTIQIGVSERRAEDGSLCVCLAVRDNGPGIPEEHRDKVFQPFFTTKREAGGTGLGLSTSLGIVESHGGSMKVDSRTGRYTEVWVSLPQAPANDET